MKPAPKTFEPPMNADRTRIILSAFICVHRRPIINKAEAYGSPGPAVDRPASSPGEQVKPAPKTFELPMNADKRGSNKGLPIGVHLRSSAANNRHAGTPEWFAFLPASSPGEQVKPAQKTFEPPMSADKRRSKKNPIGVHLRSSAANNRHAGAPEWFAFRRASPPQRGPALCP